MVVFYPTKFYLAPSQLLLEMGSEERLLPHTDAQQHLTSVAPEEFNGWWKVLPLWCLACKTISFSSNLWSFHRLCCSKCSLIEMEVKNFLNQKCYASIVCNRLVTYLIICCMACSYSKICIHSAHALKRVILSLKKHNTDRRDILNRPHHFA